MPHIYMLPGGRRAVFVFSPPQPHSVPPLPWADGARRWSLGFNVVGAVPKKPPAAALLGRTGPGLLTNNLPAQLAGAKTGRGGFGLLRVSNRGPGRGGKKAAFYGRAG